LIPTRLLRGELGDANWWRRMDVDQAVRRRPLRWLLPRPIPQPIPTLLLPHMRQPNQRPLASRPELTPGKSQLKLLHGLWGRTRAAYGRLVQETRSS